MNYVYLSVALAIIFFVIKLLSSNSNSDVSTACGEISDSNHETFREMGSDDYPVPDLSLPYEDDFMFDDKGVHDHGG